MSFKEHNNRKIANQHAEYITSEALRQYLADKVKAYCGEHVSVFDGAAGSGQLEQFIQLVDFYAVEIQALACETLKENFPSAHVTNTSFFLYEGEGVEVDAIMMNPPYSIKFKDLPEEDQKAIQELYPWKKSGVVDDIFLLKSLRYTKRYGFYIMFPGIGYRGTEKKMRELIGNQLAELNSLENGFEDTSIKTLFLVIDKEKTSPIVKREIYDAKKREVLYADEGRLEAGENWETAQLPVKREVIDIDECVKASHRFSLSHLDNHLNLMRLEEETDGRNTGVLPFINDAREILDKHELEYNFGVTIL